MIKSYTSDEWNELTKFDTAKAHLEKEIADKEAKKQSVAEAKKKKGYMPPSGSVSKDSD